MESLEDHNLGQFHYILLTIDGFPRTDLFHFAFVIQIIPTLKRKLCLATLKFSRLVTFISVVTIDMITDTRLQL